MKIIIKESKLNDVRKKYLEYFFTSIYNVDFGRTSIRVFSDDDIVVIYTELNKHLRIYERFLTEFTSLFFINKLEAIEFFVDWFINVYGVKIDTVIGKSEHRDLDYHLDIR